MQSAGRVYQLAGTIVAGSPLSGAGCLANLERNLDTILSPAASGNITFLPYGPVAGLAQIFARLWFG